MTCYKPVTVPSKAVDAKQGQVMQVPCGKCVGCLTDRQNGWIYRLQRECYTTKHSFFVTLTYDPAFVPLILENGDILRYCDYLKQKKVVDCDMTVYPLDLTNFFKRFRKAISPANFKYFACMEYGDQFGRPHYHFAMFTNDNISDLENIITKCWPYGMTQIDVLTDSRISYVTKYILKGNLEAPPSERCLPCCQRASHGLGIIGFFDDEHSTIVCKSSDEYLKQVELNNGVKVSTPRYFRRKFYNQQQFTQTKIDENERFRQKKEQRDFERHCQDLLIRSGQLSFEEATSTYLQNHDFERIRRNSLETRLRRKGM